MLFRSTLINSYFMRTRSLITDYSVRIRSSFPNSAPTTTHGSNDGESITARSNSLD
ncbi:hypothetical protein BDV33DRAFT_176599 [Aspergillus novoparasiticus]|uniref:Uncharacterized protein n=2 Tax=Aspergillus subgen. Circumdati TaxID=2720871 RepID=A0A5N6EL75_9EURO|nr:hypothetical protein BDV33DRAFT_176599 [Aspergillus novoparasiticus]KAE8306866.1 hypothetical protein BDV41DRAFT_556908 [Aspergillus transmontanensis]